MSPPYRAIAFSGSLREGSSNTALVRLAQRVAPPELSIDVVDGLDRLPWMNPDLEADPPEVVRRWWDALRAADALVVGLPEYNAGPAPLAKNALDWATRPPHDRAIAGTAVAFLSSAGRSGGANAQGPIGKVLGFLGALVVEEPAVRLSFVADRLAPDGATTDPEIEAVVAAKLAAVVAALDQRAAAADA